VRTVIVQLDWTIQQLFRSISSGFPGQACPRETCPHENGERGPGNDKKEIPIQLNYPPLALDIDANVSYSVLLRHSRPCFRRGKPCPHESGDCPRPRSGSGNLRIRDSLSQM